jgi:H+-translocating NAD(P) transhydrogenase subunit alpha
MSTSNGPLPAGGGPDPRSVGTVRIAVPRESRPGERRVAATPDTVTRLIKLGFSVSVQRGAGVEAGYVDAAYAEAGAALVEDAFSAARVVIKVNPPEPAEIERLDEGAVIISMLYPAQNQATVELLARRKVTSLALDKIPRISRAQKMDVLSSMANIAGYRAVIEAANVLPRFFGGQITAAGKTPPARVLIIGAGVAGLAAIGAARGLGGEVYAFDTRAPVREQVESLGGRFLTVELDESGEGAGGYAREMSQAFIDAEMALFREHAPKVDVVITTALIPGKPAPKLWTRDMVEAMKPGSVVVDLASSQGGNCEVTVPGQAVQHQGVHIIGYTDLTSRLPGHASQFFARNIVHLLEDMGGGTAFRVDHQDECVRAALITEAGFILPPPLTSTPSPGAAPAPAAAAKAAKVAPPAPALPAPPRSAHGHIDARPASLGTTALVGMVSAGLLGGLAVVAPPEFLQHFTVFVLAVLIGWQVVWNVTPALHTPLMSVTNAISGIILVGGMLQAGTGHQDAATILGAVALLLAAINVFGGFLVTQRMLRMFRK